MRNEEVASWIERFVASYGAGRLAKWWRKPLFAVASASDPLFNFFKKLHGFAEPRELVEGARSVIVVFLPFAKWVVVSNESPGPASREWARAYLEANRLLQRMGEGLAKWLRRGGFKSTSIPPTGGFSLEEFKAEWSHRHAAYIAGLGTFGVHGLLITEQGCCGRLTSLITQAPLQPGRRLSELCLHKAGEDCLKCVERCAWSALTPRGLDKEKCYEVCLANAKRYEDLDYPDVCGKCACGVPCSLRSPLKQGF